MQNTWRTQVKRITVAIIAAMAIAGGVQIAAEDGPAGSSGSAGTGVTADATTPQAPPAAPTPSPSATKDNDEWS
ncbi:MULTISPECIES: hypothetical protein [Streptomyces]|uniref:hypothetical protein n=1 Tax=Streptomyces TaxID=1883 RepID=UPI000F70A083|nr:MULTISPECIES: hypothetical protein [unclassified Streptomyces]AZM91690.1 hypothetical protein D1J60_27045 [Streptomyces sp. W1SF4]RSS58385.1 hypothetical protein EF912_10635 [Streptomyces sp. WAC07061]